MDVIRCLTTSLLLDWSLIGNEGAAFSLWGSWGDDGTHTDYKLGFRELKENLSYKSG